MDNNERMPGIIHSSWHEYLQPLFNNLKMKLIRDTVLPSYKYYPEGQDIFNVFEMDLNKIKVVILGQDPYANGEAIGFSFAVKESIKIPKSLEIIRNEILLSKVERDTSVNIESSKWKTLEHWRRQGVFLLNAALTVEMKNPNSHTGQWEWFTKEIIQVISKRQKPIWMLWGAKARGMLTYIKDNRTFMGEGEDIMNINPVLLAAHPAAETHPNSTVKFTGCDHFRICNKILKLRSQTIINW